nr:ATP-dependent Clp protease proteolytic subunit [Bradyrhizobium iriomotense]
MFKVLGAIGGILLFWGWFQLPSGSGDTASRQTLSISEEPDRIVLGWSGPVQEPMSERVAAAFDRYKADPRRLVLVLNSPGGSVEHGRKVVAAIRGRDHAIDTLVQRAGVCASMCVPIFLSGTRRIADPEAYFMFHQVSLSGSAKDNTRRPELSDAELSRAVKTIEAHVTDEFFRSDIGIRGVNTVWLARMREKISGRDVWMSGQQLVDEGSGIVDRLIRTPAR